MCVPTPTAHGLVFMLKTEWNDYKKLTQERTQELAFEI